MTEHKFTDEEVIKALECCGEIDRKFCDNCTFRNEEDCVVALTKAAIDLINCQKAAIAYWMDVAVNEKRETAKEFAERAKRRLPIVSPCVFDQIVKALTEENV